MGIKLGYLGSIGLVEGDLRIQDLEKNRAILDHIDAAYNLARWLTGNEQDASDVVQDAYLRAFQFKGEVDHVKTWFLTIVRHACYKSLNKKLPSDAEDSVADLELIPAHGKSPEQQVLQNADLQLLSRALSLLPEEQREIFVLREIEELTYQEISETLEIPIGTTMSRLARSRAKLLQTILEISKSQERQPL